MGVKRIIQINCDRTKAERDAICDKCQLPLDHHGIRFEILEYDDLYDVYALHAIAREGFNPNVSINTRMLVLHVSGAAFTKFKEFV
jgi:hypothetical protein